MKKVFSLLLTLAIIALSSTMFFSCKGDESKPQDTSGDTSVADTSADVTEPATEPASDKDLQSLVDVASVNGDAGVGENEGPVSIFDGDSATKWCVGNETPTAEWKMTEAVTVNYYYFTTANDAPERNPAGWVLYGSADGSTWTELSKVEGATLPTEFFTDSEQYKVENPQSFQFYKLEITAIAEPGKGLLQFSELKLFQSAK